MSRNLGDPYRCPHPGCKASLSISGHDEGDYCDEHKPRVVDPVEAILATKCPLLHDDGKADRRCTLIHDIGGDTERGFCASRIRAALAMPRGKGPTVEVVTRGTFPPRAEPFAASPLPPFDQAWARYKAKGYQYGEDALTNVEFGYEIAGEELARTAERSEGVKESAAGSPSRACKTHGSYNCGCTGGR